jgi:hypothetical protein
LSGLSASGRIRRSKLAAAAAGLTKRTRKQRDGQQKQRNKNGSSPTRRVTAERRRQAKMGYDFSDSLFNHF